jgi:hypothetical protein
MPDLLALAVEAHGGLSGGAIWDFTGVVDDPKDAMARLAYDTPWNAIDAELRFR